MEQQELSKTESKLYQAVRSCNTIEGLQRRTGLSKGTITKTIASMENDNLIVTDYSNERKPRIFRVSDFIYSDKNAQSVEEWFGSEGLRVYLLVDGKRNTGEIQRIANSPNIESIVDRMLEKKMLFFDRLDEKQTPLPLIHVRKPGAKTASEEDNYRVMIVSYTKMLQKRERSEIYFKRGFCYYNIDLYQKAIDDYTKAIKLNEKVSSYYLNRSAAFNEIKDFDKVIKDTTKAIALKPNNFNAFYNRGFAYMHIKKYESAIKDFSKAIDIMPNDADFYYQRGCAYGYTGKFSDAIRDYEKTIEIDNQYAGAKERLKIIQEKQKQEINELVAIDPTVKKIIEDKYDSDGFKFIASDANAKLLNEKFGMGAIKIYVLSNGERSLIQIKRMVKTRDFEKIMRFMVATGSIVLAELRGKKTPFAWSFQHDADDGFYSFFPVTMGSSGMARNRNFEKGNYEEVIKYYTSVLRFRKQHNAYFKRAYCYYCLGWYDKTIEDYTCAMKLCRTKPAYYINRGAAFYRKKEFQNAIKDFKRAVKLDPNNFKAWYNLGLANASIEEYERAVQNVSEVLKLTQDLVGDYHHLRGLTYEYAGKLDEAIADYENALRINPGMCDAKTHLTCAKAKQEEAQKAEKLTSGTELKYLTDPSTMFRIPLVKLSHVGGMKKLKGGKIAEVLNLLRSEGAEKAERYGIRFGGGVLLYGPPGCGKSFVAEAIAGEAGVTFIKVNIADTLNMYVGNSEKNLRRIFEHARKNQPVIIFFDELEALGGSRESMLEHWGKVLIDQFLMEMDQIEKQKEKVLVIGATNAPWFVDNALQRSGRFSERVFIEPPDAEARKEIFKIYAKKIKLLGRLDYDKLAKMSEGCSCADIEFICKQAAKNVWLEGLSKRATEKVKTADFIKVTAECIKEGRFTNIEKWFELMKNHACGSFFQGNNVGIKDKVKKGKTVEHCMYG